MAFTMLPTIEEKKNDDDDDHEDTQSNGLLRKTKTYYQAASSVEHPPTTASSYHSRSKSSLRRTTRLPLKPFHSAVIVAVLLLLIIFVVTDRFVRLRKPLVDSHTNAIVLYDYIVVGAGPAGIITATRIARKLPDANVVLLEAGVSSQSDVLQRLQQRQSRDDEKTTSKPSWTNGALFVNEFDVPLLWSGSATGKRHHWPIELLGKTIGGSALFNAMVYIRSLASDWVNVTGAWNYNSILSAYQDMEDYQLDDGQDFRQKNSKKNNTNTSYRGFGGPLASTPISAVDAVGPLFVASAERVGYSRVTSFNKVGQERANTVGYYEFNIRDGVRDSVAQSYLGRSSTIIPRNLRILPGVTVTRVIRLGGVSVGVEYVQGHHILQFLLQPGGEVILSAGAIMTPQILYNSGFNYTYQVQDHPVVTIGFSMDASVALDAPSIYMLGNEFNDYFEASSQLKTGTLNTTEEIKARKHLGPLATPGFSAGAFLRSPWAETDSPDLQLTIFPRHLEPHVVLSSKQNHPAMLVTVALLQPEARYRVRPSSSSSKLVEMPADEKETILKDPNKAHMWKRVFDYSLPSIEVMEDEDHYLTDSDIQRLAWGIKQVRKIQQRPPLSLQTGPEIYPAGQDLRDYIRSHHLTNSHWAGTTPIGSLVDDRLRIDDSLRIVDAGVIPRMPNGNIHSTVCAIAHIAADMIVEDRIRNADNSR